MPWFVKIERGIVDKATFDQHVPAHKAYIQLLMQQGHSPRTGYWANSRGGMLLFMAESFDAAFKIVERDPLIVYQCVEYELQEWVIVAGDPLS